MPFVDLMLCTTLGLYKGACEDAEVSDASTLMLVHALPEIGTHVVSLLPQPNPTTADVVKNLDDLWVVKLWRETPLAMQCFGHFFPLSPNA